MFHSDRPKPKNRILEEDGTLSILLNAYLNGDKSAFSKIYLLYVDELYSYGIGLGCDREKLKDIIQDIFYKIYTNPDYLKVVKNLKYYLFKMLKNKVLDIYKNKVVIDDINTDELTFTIKTNILDHLIVEEDRRLLESRVENLLKTLTDRQREAVYLRFIQEMEYEEVGELLEMTPQAARKLIFRALKRIREQNPI